MKNDSFIKRCAQALIKKDPIEIIDISQELNETDINGADIAKIEQGLVGVFPEGNSADDKVSFFINLIHEIQETGEPSRLTKYAIMATAEASKDMTEIPDGYWDVYQLSHHYSKTESQFTENPAYDTKIAINATHCLGKKENSPQKAEEAVELITTLNTRETSDTALLPAVGLFIDTLSDQNISLGQAEPIFEKAHERFDKEVPLSYSSARREIGARILQAHLEKISLSVLVAPEKRFDKLATMMESPRMEKKKGLVKQFIDPLVAILKDIPVQDTREAMAKRINSLTAKREIELTGNQNEEIKEALKVRINQSEVDSLKSLMGALPFVSADTGMAIFQENLSKTNLPEGEPTDIEGQS